MSQLQRPPPDAPSQHDTNEDCLTAMKRETTDANTTTDFGGRRYRILDDLIERSVGDDLLIHRIDTDDVFVLNPHAQIVLTAVRSASSHAEVQSTVMRCGFADERAMRALDGALEELLNQGLIAVASD
jgi:hypothetical protein